MIYIRLSLMWAPDICGNDLKLASSQRGWHSMLNARRPNSLSPGCQRYSFFVTLNLRIQTHPYNIRKKSSVKGHTCLALPKWVRSESVVSLCLALPELLLTEVVFRVSMFWAAQVVSCCWLLEVIIVRKTSYVLLFIFCQLTGTVWGWTSHCLRFLSSQNRISNALQRKWKNQARPRENR